MHIRTALDKGVSVMHIGFDLPRIPRLCGRNLRLVRIRSQVLPAEPQEPQLLHKIPPITNFRAKEHTLDEGSVTPLSNLDSWKNSSQGM